MRKNRILALFVLSLGLLSFMVTPVSAASKGNLLSPDRILTVAHRGLLDMCLSTRFCLTKPLRK